MDIVGKTATEVMKKAIDSVLFNGESQEVYGGTIPKNISDPKSPNDFKREMIELPPGFTMVLTNPLANWTDYSDHWVGITLRETEDHFQCYNPGHVVKYSKLYNRWLEDNYFNYTYGERFLSYPYNLEQISGKHKNIGWDFDQVHKAIDMLKENPSTRKCCISTWYPTSDLGNNYCPCNMVMQLRVLDNKLHWTTVIRSLDVLRGLSENLFMFTMWQQYIAKQLDVGLGPYTTVALNAHLYADQIEAGYHKQNIPDCYDYYTPKQAFEFPFPTYKFRNIDDLLFNKRDIFYVLFLDAFSELPPYWRNWKQVLVADWLRKTNIEVAEKMLKGSDTCTKVDNEFLFSVVRRMAKKDSKYIDLLPWQTQRKFIAKELE